MSDMPEVMPDSDEPALPDTTTAEPATPALTAASIVHYNAFASHTPEAALLEYTALIEDGSFEAATALVPPAGVDGTAIFYFGPNAIPRVTAPESIVASELLSDDFAKDSLTLPSAFTFTRPESPAPTDIGVGQTITVAVNYKLEDIKGSAPIRVERQANSWLGMPQWKVLDSLAIPVAVPVHNPQITTALVNGQKIAASADPLSGYPQFQSFLYPGIVTITPSVGVSDLVFGDEGQLTVVHDSSLMKLNSEFEPFLVPYADSFNTARGLPDLRPGIAPKLEEQFEACFTSASDQLAGACPAEVIALQQSGAQLEISPGATRARIYTRPIEFSPDLQDYPSTTFVEFEVYLKVTQTDGSINRSYVTYTGTLDFLRRFEVTLAFDTVGER